MPLHDDRVLVLEELAGDALAEHNVPRAPPGKLHHGAKGGNVGAGDGARAEKVSRLHVAARHGMVGELLRKGPVQVLEVARHDGRGGGGVGGLDLDLEVDVDRAPRLGLLQVGKDGDLVLGAGN